MAKSPVTFIASVLFTSVAAVLASAQARTIADPSAWGNLSNGFELGIAQGSDQFVSGGSMPIIVFLKDVSGGQLTMNRKIFPNQYRYEVVKDGQPVAPREDTSGGGHYSGPSLGVTFQTGQMRSETVDLSKIYSLKPGTYTLRVTMPLLSQDLRERTAPTSAPLTFTVY